MRIEVGGGVQVPARMLVYRAPSSFTGEDSAEVLVCGNPWLTERIVTRLCEQSEGRVRPAQAGEFAARAYLAGRLSLAQAEGIAAVIAAGDGDELAAARRVLESGTGTEVRGAAGLYSLVRLCPGQARWRRPACADGQWAGHDRADRHRQLQPDARAGLCRWAGCRRMADRARSGEAVDLN